MKLYQYRVVGNDFEKRVYDVEEKPKTYVASGGYPRFKKEKMNQAFSDYGTPTLLTLEDNDDKARGLLLELLAEKKIALEKKHKAALDTIKGKMAAITASPVVT